MTSPKPSAAAMEAALLPCPFCGGEAHVSKLGERLPPWYSIGCQDPHCVGWTGKSDSDKTALVAVWNHRAHPAAEPGLRAAAQALLDKLLQMGGGFNGMLGEELQALRAALAALEESKA